MVLKIFLRCNSKDLLDECLYIKENLMEDIVLKNFISIFLSEENANSSSFLSDNLHLLELTSSDIYIAVLGYKYGNHNEKGISSTELQYMEFKKRNSNSLFYLKNMVIREKKTKEFINRIQKETTYFTFDSKEELVTDIKKSIISYINKRLSTEVFDETIINNSSIEDIDDHAYNLYFQYLDKNILKKLEEYENKKEILNNINAGNLNGSNFHFNNAGALFFSKNIENYKLAHKIKMVRFLDETELTVIEKKESHAPIPILLKEVESFFRRNTKQGLIVKGFESVSIPEYPFEAVKEAVINAIVHRDYTIHDDFITFHIYSNRIEITSPGRSLVQIENINENKIHRNKILYTLLSYNILVKHEKTGIYRMKKAMDEEGLCEPEFFNFINNFKVVLWGRNEMEELPKRLTMDDNKVNLKEIGLKNRQIEALKLIINDSKKINAKIYSKRFNVSQPTSSRDLNDMVQKKLITKEKKGKTTYFMKIS